MLQKNTYSPFRKPELSCLRALSFIFILALILFISTTNAYSAQVTLAWNPNTESDLAGHKLYNGYTSGNYEKVTDVGNQTSYTLSNLVEGQKYYIALTAYDTFNNESGYSSEVVYTVPTLDLTAPSTPTSLQATTISTSQINLSWNASSDNIGVTGYRIYRDSTQIATTSNTTYQDTGLSSSTTYSYTVSAYDAAGNESGKSSASSATTTASNINRPPVLDAIANIMVNEGVTITLNPTATDPDGDALTYTYTGWMTSSSYTTNFNDSGTHTVTVTVSDGTLTDSQDVTVMVLNANSNSAPVLDTIANITVNEGATITLSPTATDPNGDALTYTYTGWMTSSSYTTNYNDAGTHTITVTVSDGSLSDSQVVTLTVVEKDKEPLEISNLTAASGETYEIVENGLQNGAVVYIDRNYAYSTIPTWLQGTTYIKTANNDKRSSPASFLTFDVNQDVIVYVAHDNSITTKPSWLEPFTDAGDDLVTTDTTLSLFKYNFSAGTITLGGNESSGNSMYTVIIVGQGNGNMDGNGQDDVIVDFGIYGIYVIMNNSTWVKLHTRSPESITIGNSDGN